MCVCVCVLGGGGKQGYLQLDPGMDTLIKSIRFLHLVLAHLLRCGEPIGGVIFKSTQSLGGLGVSAVGRFNSQLSYLSKILLNPSLSSPGETHVTSLGGEQVQVQVLVCLCVSVCMSEREIKALQLNLLC